ncbi:protein containing leucine rich repeats [Lentimicrobium saccharophilum]|uniref:Protein containing leucine rich repeats n=1 Tax=Lentimicrobium saccharophilum TaxID=1678841 RepID=A0A0S7C4F6_9BACT|nr:leucine-rich repeat domain-containing protein [Lentimicrobium saccharophilum]GAP45057.1 protein containing leucine rich repeats [Lentimicrobium saccharophilum]
MNKLLQIGVLFLLVIVAFSGFAQQNEKVPDSASVSGLSAEELAGYQKQAAQLVNFMEYAFNTLGSAKAEYKEKDIIINQSFLKFFRDARVQIEDDLVEKRDVVTNKDVQAYLKDIDFFFREVAFRFTIEEITQETNEKGELYFKIKTSRNLNGITLEGVKINDNKPRFIEINLDDASRDLKIASIYTTRSSEEQELITWWNNLGKGWRNFFSGNTLAGEDIPMHEIIAIGRDYMVRANGNFSQADSTETGDTLFVSPAGVFNEIRRIWRTEEIDISGVPGIYDLDPLSALTALKHLNISGAKVVKPEPIRNLSKLETFIASGTLISSINALQYSTSLRYLDLSNTFIADIEPVANFKMLEYLFLTGLSVDDISPIRELIKLKELRLNNLPVKSLESLSGLSGLEVLDLSGTPLNDLTTLTGMENLKRVLLVQTYISDISPLAEMPSLEYVYLDRSPVAQIAPLKNLKKLKVIYCDKTFVNKAIAQEFMQQQPGVKVIYESEELTAWWQTMPDIWKGVFSAMLPLDSPPQREQLHEISFLRRIDISGNQGITTLDPLRKLSSLNQLYAASTGITDLMAIKDLFDLEVLDVSNTLVIDAGPLSRLEKLRDLNISGTKVVDLIPLKGLSNLRRIGIDQLQAQNLEILSGFSRLELIYGDGVPGLSRVVERLWDSIPGVLVIYQTPELQKWWASLDQVWKRVFSGYEPVGVEPDRDQLHKIASIRNLDISRNREIVSLMPVSMLKRLEVLNMSGVQVSDLLPLGLITRLQELDCSDTPLSDLSPITTHRTLKKLNCSNTPLSKIDPLEFLPELEILDISGTQISRLNALSSARQLVYLSCFNTRVSNLKPLEDLTNLKTLKIYNTRVSAKRADQFRSSRPGVEVIYY